jgi:hypothetical protein
MKIAKEIDRSSSTLIGRHVDGFKGIGVTGKQQKGRTEGRCAIPCNAMQRDPLGCAAIKVSNDDEEEGIETRGKSIGRTTKYVCVYGSLQKEARGADRVLTDNGLLL